MTRLVIPSRAIDVIRTIDDLILYPHVDITNPVTSRKLGYYAGDLRKNKSLTIAKDPLTGDTIARLKTKNVQKKQGTGRNIEYLFDDFNIKIHKIEL